MGSIRRSKTKRRTRDLDQIRADLSSAKHLSQYKQTKATEDLPGLGAHFCTECSKWFESEYNMLAHRKGKNHKRRIRMLKEEPHSQKMAEAAVGLGVDNGERGEKGKKKGVEEEGDAEMDTTI
ncbi:Bud site selection protein 20 [Arachnomyces sp. PD_36]|nr:Bud site selection protein 20 [Arachnomyces sp. PD_36]